MSSSSTSSSPSWTISSSLSLSLSSSSSSSSPSSISSSSSIWSSISSYSSSLSSRLPDLSPSSRTHIDGKQSQQRDIDTTHTSEPQLSDWTDHSDMSDHLAYNTNKRYIPLFQRTSVWSDQWWWLLQGKTLVPSSMLVGNNIHTWLHVPYSS